MIESRIATLTPPINARDHLRGSLRAPVAILEFGDYECPFCGRAHLIVKDLVDRVGAEICFAFRHFPLSRIHPNAQRAAHAVGAAAVQGRFWAMHDLLFTHQDAQEDSDMFGYAAMLGLEMNRFSEDFASQVFADQVREDFMSGVWSGVNGTPAFFINGHRHDGPWDLLTLSAAIELVTPRGRAIYR